MSFFPTYHITVDSQGTILSSFRFSCFSFSVRDNHAVLTTSSSRFLSSWPFAHPPVFKVPFLRILVALIVDIVSSTIYSSERWLNCVDKRFNSLSASVAKNCAAGRSAEGSAVNDG